MKGSPGRSLSSSTKALSCISSPKVSCFSNFFGSTASLFSEEVSEEGWGEGEDLEDDERGEDECWAGGVEEGGAAGGGGGGEELLRWQEYLLVFLSEDKYLHKIGH